MSFLSASRTTQALIFRIVFAFSILALVLIFLQRLSSSLAAPPVHPVDVLHSDAVQKHHKFTSRQSTTLEQAVSTYRRRYDEEPPPGFSHWVKKAQEWNSTVTDDYDAIRDQLKPFRHYLRNRYDLNLTQDDVGALWNERLLQVCFRDHGKLEFAGYQEEWFVNAFQGSVGDFANQIPELCILVNTLDEPRSILGPGELPKALRAQRHSLSITHVPNHKSSWSHVSLPCRSSPYTSCKNAPGRLSASDADKYATDDWTNTDVCCQQEQLPHGLIQSPENVAFTHDAVPILSPAKLSTFSDVLFPSIWRFQENSTYSPGDDREWVEKSSKVYWRGSTTGGHGSDHSWKTLHRQALIRKLTRLFQRKTKDLNVAFTAVIQCDESACIAQNSTLPTDERQPMEKGWQYKLLLDMDGNGLSGRLYGLLRSKSAVLRHSFMREWHDERLQPWLHYVPLTAGASETVDIVDFFFRCSRGDDVARSIADAGREWAARALRPEDMKLYFYRLLLEMARDR